MKTTKLFRNYLGAKKASKIVINIDELDKMVTLPADERGTVPLTDVLYIEQHDMKYLYKELLALPNFVIPFANKQGGWNFCLNEVEEHELDYTISFPDVWEGQEINTDEESLDNFVARFEEANTIEDLLDPPKECLIDEEIVEAMRCYDISFEHLVYLSKEYTPESGERIGNWMRRIWEDYESARLYLNDKNNNGTDAHKRKLWRMDNAYNDYNLSAYQGDELFPIRLKDVIVYNIDTLSFLTELGSGFPETDFSLITLSTLYREYMDGSSSLTIESKISEEWEDISKCAYTRIINKKEFNRIVNKYVKKKVY